MRKKLDVKLSVIGLGYVGLQLAIAFAKKVNVIGFDINKEKIKTYNLGIDPTSEVGNDEVRNSNVIFTSDSSRLKECNFHIVAVPTPTNDDKTPDLSPIICASKIIGRNLSKGSIVVYESTVYPGVTEDICVPILEKESRLKCGVDFKVGYSPERINPGDKVHRLENIVKIVSGMDDETLEIVAKVYELVIEAGIYKAESIKVAEAAKLIENCQRDVMISLVNELAIILDKMGLDTKVVIEAAESKWNFIKMNPGLVGGHCIGVDPYYLIHMAKEIGLESKVIAAAREINDRMAKYIVEKTVKCLIKANKRVKGAKVAILGVTYKEDCPDTRNTKVIDIINELKDYDIDVIITDPVADKNEFKIAYKLDLEEIDNINGVDAVILTVAHSEYRNMDFEDFISIFSKYKELDERDITEDKEEKKVLIDVKGILNKSRFNKEEFIYWRL
ncbi:nucleotide sugar dehydrogenase [Clostridium sp. AL.422]|uniref:nucleotide sugar dehydrogenase n=1 Tax=Clostridium TaxID=1485 RepID=UPI00293DBD4F|nr:MULTISPECIES: nucleotide sugar dehydrogenase [unclassified Clostridium]MDV4150278.1 nucleotide sugar dehydrogenase [Clostridium sp. AL.422]